MQQTEPTYDYTDFVINQKYQFATPENREKILKYIVHIEQAVENYFISVGSRFIYIERRPIEPVDWHIGYSVLFFAAILFLGFLTYPVLISSFVNLSFFFIIGGPLHIGGKYQGIKTKKITFTQPLYLAILPTY